MFSRFAFNNIKSILNEWFEDVEAHQMKFTLTSSTLEIRDLSLKKDIFNDMHLPFRMKLGFVSRIHVRNLLGSVMGDPIILTVSQLILVLTNPSDDWSKQRLHYAKQCRIKFLQSYLKPPIVLDSQKYEKQASSIDISDVGMSDRIKAWINHRFTSNMSKNLVIQIDQVHFRYEDFHRANNTTFGVIVQQLSLSSVPRSQGNICKNLHIDRVSVYWNYDSKAQDECIPNDFRFDAQSIKQIFSKIESQTHIGLLHPTSIRMQIEYSSKNGLTCLIRMENLITNLDLKQIEGLFKFLQEYSLFERKWEHIKHYPNLNMRSNESQARVWWKFAINAVLEDIRIAARKKLLKHVGPSNSSRASFVRRIGNHYSIAQVVDRQKLLRRYVEYYKKALAENEQNLQFFDRIGWNKERLTKHEWEVLTNLDFILPVKQVVFFRAVAEAELRARIMSPNTHVSNVPLSHSQNILEDESDSGSSVSDTDLSETPSILKPDLSLLASPMPSFVYNSSSFEGSNALMSKKQMLNKQPRRFSFSSGSMSTVQFGLGSLGVELIPDVCNVGAVVYRFASGIQVNESEPLVLGQAEASGNVELGDIIAFVNGENCLFSIFEDVLHKIKDAREALEKKDGEGSITVVFLRDWMYYALIQRKNPQKEMIRNMTQGELNEFLLSPTDLESDNASVSECDEEKRVDECLHETAKAETKDKNQYFQSKGELNSLVGLEQSHTVNSQEISAKSTKRLSSRKNSLSSIALSDQPLPKVASLWKALRNIIIELRIEDWTAAVKEPLKDVEFARTRVPIVEICLNRLVFSFANHTAQLECNLILLKDYACHMRMLSKQDPQTLSLTKEIESIQPPTSFSNFIATWNRDKRDNAEPIARVPNDLSYQGITVARVENFRIVAQVGEKVNAKPNAKSTNGQSNKLRFRQIAANSEKQGATDRGEISSKWNCNLSIQASSILINYSESIFEAWRNLYLYNDVSADPNSIELDTKFPSLCGLLSQQHTFLREIADQWKKSNAQRFTHELDEDVQKWISRAILILAIFSNDFEVGIDFDLMQFTTVREITSLSTFSSFPDTPILRSIELESEREVDHIIVIKTINTETVFNMSDDVAVRFLRHLSRILQVNWDDWLLNLDEALKIVR